MAVTLANLNSTYTPDIQQVEALLKEAFPKLLIVWFHSGGGIFGFLIEHESGSHLFWGTADQTWGYDRHTSDGAVIKPIDPQSTNIPSEGFEPTVLAEAIKESIRTYL